jgi:hypothetical protein
VEKDQFIQVVHHFSGSSVQEAQDVLSLKESYPYSQLLHALSARVSKDHGFSTHSGELQMAAVYAADRGVLKEIMLEDFTSSSDGSQVSVITVTAPSTAYRQPALQSAPALIEPSEDVADEILHDLERLNELKLNFERLFTEGFVGSTPTVTTTVDVSADDDVSLAPSSSVEGKGSLSKKERIVALAKSLENKGVEPTPDTAKPKKKRKQEGEELIEEIASSKAQIEPENEKQKEQIELIEQFIKTQPSISNVKDKPVDLPVGDLSPNAAEFGDHIVSETLVEILIKQGKKDRAIEVLKKLIWKFPQKKAYFAAQIEDLKK